MIGVQAWPAPQWIFVSYLCHSNNELDGIVSISVANTLKDMGMPAAFDPDQANFSGMDGSRDLFIGDVLHKAFVDVNEEGTEAAAATAIVVGVEALPGLDVELMIDRPFIFLIRDVPTDSIIFIGRVINPGQ